jgi:5-methylcytosine-specific restriction endonuclease McrA
MKSCGGGSGEQVLVEKNEATGSGYHDCHDDGGRNTWKNTVAACDPCNQRKGDRTPAEAGMVLRVQPAAPSWAALAHR